MKTAISKGTETQADRVLLARPCPCLLPSAHTHPQAALLTGEHGGHEGSKHEEQHGEEEAAGVVEDLAGVVPDVQVEEANEHADQHVGHKAQVGQDLEGGARGRAAQARAHGAGTQTRPQGHWSAVGRILSSRPTSCDPTAQRPGMLRLLCPNWTPYLLCP